MEPLFDDNVGPLEIDPVNCEIAFRTRELRISSEVKLAAKIGYIMTKSIVFKGSLGETENVKENHIKSQVKL